MSLAPLGGAPGANVNLNRPRSPSLLKAIRATQDGRWGGAGLERELSDTAAELFGYGSVNDHALIVATSPAEYLAVLDAAEVTTYRSPAIRALGEGTTSVGSVTGAGALVAPQFLVGEFALPLLGAQVLRQMPEVVIVPVTSPVAEQPSESAGGAAIAGTENTAITANDFTAALAEVRLRKASRLQVLSNELAGDIGEPGVEVVLQRILAFEIAAWLDQQELEGAGTGVTIKGLRNMSGFTTSSWVAATNGSTPNGDDISSMVQDIFTANAYPTALIMHPRTFFKLARIKDTAGNYVFPGLVAAAASVGVEDFSRPRRVGSLFGAAIWLTTSIPVTEVQGSSNAATHIIYGDFSKLLILVRQGIELFYSQEVFLNADQLAIRATARENIVPVQPLAFSVATGII
jgi:HK97 family phage major capsid protein